MNSPRIIDGWPGSQIVRMVSYDAGGTPFVIGINHTTHAKIDAATADDLMLAKAEEFRDIVESGEHDFGELGFTPNGEHPEVWEFYPSAQTLQAWGEAE